MPGRLNTPAWGLEKILQMKNKCFIFFIPILFLALIPAAQAWAQSGGGFNPSEDFRTSYPNELKKENRRPAKKSQKNEARQNQPEEAKEEAAPTTASPAPAPTQEAATGRTPPKIVPLDQLPDSLPAPRDNNYTPPPAAQEPQSYSPPPQAQTGAGQSQGGQAPSGQSDYAPPPAYYDQSGSEPAPAAAQPTQPNQASGATDDSFFEEYSQPPAAINREESPEAKPEIQESVSAPAPAAPQAPPASRAVSPVEATDYSNPDSWMYLTQSPDKDVDIFFLYTGSCSGSGTCSISDAGMRQKALEKTMQQAGAFEPSGNMFVPYYRQLNSSIFLGLKPAERIARMAVSSADAYAAFDYYMNHYNQGRPFILAAHGQGSAALLDGILSRYLEQNQAARRQLVAAYAIGYSVTVDYLSQNPHLKIAERRNDIGVIISYSTEAPGVKATNPAVLPGSVAINPVNWSRSERKALPNLSRGANLSAFGEEEYKEAFADARVNMARGIVECSLANLDKYASPDFPHGAFPDGDYAFFFYDLRLNAQERVEAYRQARP